MFFSHVYVSLPFWLAVCLAFVYGENNEIVTELTCNLKTDFCGWSSKMEALSPSEFDVGWRIYSPHLDGNQFEVDENGDRFAYASSQVQARTYLRSLPTTVDPKLVTVSFKYVTTGNAFIILYAVSDTGHKVLWSSNREGEDGLEKINETTPQSIVDGDNFTMPNNETMEVELIGENTLTTVDDWEMKRDISICQFITMPKFFQLSFVAYVSDNESVALSDVVATKLPETPKECSDESLDSTDNNQDNSPSWKFFIIFTLFLCFGSVFVGALLVIGRSTKTIYVPPNIERTPDDNLTFKYKKLREMDTY